MIAPLLLSQHASPQPQLEVESYEMDAASEFDGSESVFS
jgi:hypothetical protein